MKKHQEFFFPIGKKYLPILKVITMPCAHVYYNFSEYGVIEIVEIGFAPSILKYISNHSDLIAEIEEAAREHYKDIAIIA